MDRDSFEIILANLNALHFVEGTVAINAITSCGGYSSAQCNMRFKIKDVVCQDKFITFPTYKGNERYNPFSCGKLIDGGEPVYIPYSSIVCVIGVK